MAQGGGGRSRTTTAHLDDIKLDGAREAGGAGPCSVPRKRDRGGPTAKDGEQSKSWCRAHLASTFSRVCHENVVAVALEQAVRR